MSTFEEHHGATTEAGAVAELTAHPYIAPIDFEGRYGVALPPDWTFDTFLEDRDAERPRRSTGVVRVHDGDSFVRSVLDRALEGRGYASVYADENDLSLVCVLNDDRNTAPGWRDYRVALTLRSTVEWQHWSRLDGKLVEQEAFAEHVEDGLNELRDPSPAVMLEIAQTIHATTTATMKAAHRLSSGLVQFRYEEDGSAGAGEGGALSIPETLSLVLRPFIGGPAYEMSARFRYRLARGDVSLGYKLDRPHEVQRAAFRDAVDVVRAGLPEPVPFVNGPAPAEV